MNIVNGVENNPNYQILYMDVPQLKQCAIKKFAQTLNQNIDYLLMQINTKLNVGLCTLSTILDKNGLGLFMVRAGCCKVYQGCRDV